MLKSPLAEWRMKPKLKTKMKKNEDQNCQKESVKDNLIVIH